MKICKIIASLIITVLVILLFAPSVLGINTPVVLMYHLIEEEPFTEWESLFVRPEEFEAQLNMLKDEGYEFLFASEYKRSTKCKSVILTFDDGYLDNYTDMLPILEKCGAKATVFVTSGNIGMANFLGEEELIALANSPCIEIGSHTVSHALLTEISSENAEKELKESKNELEACTGKNVSSFSFPEGRFSLKLLRVTRKYYDTAYITKTAKPDLLTNRMKIPRISVPRGTDADELMQMIDSPWNRRRRIKADD